MATELPWLASYPSAARWDVSFPPERVDRLLDETVERFPDRPCVEFLGKRYSYREIGDYVARAAAGLQARGVTKGTRVGLFMPNCPYSVIAYYAILKTGGIVVSFNPLYAEAELRHQIRDSGVEIMMTLDLAALHGPLLKMLDGSTPLKTVVCCSMADALPFPKNRLFGLLRRRERAAVPNDGRHVAFATLTENDGKVAPVEIDPLRDVAVLQYTGGTTGTPKGAMLTHDNLSVNARQCRAWFPTLAPGGERVVAVLPFFHVFGMSVVMNFGVAIGAELILLPRFELKQLLETINARKPTVFAGVPTIFNAINTHADASRYDLSSIKRCFSGGAPLPVEVKAKFERNTGCILVEGYGLTETAPVVTSNPPEGLNKPGSIGVPFPGTVIEIVALDGSDRVLPPGERGEVCVRGPQVMAGYWRKPEETAKVLRNGRLHTGDVGYMDEDGYVFLVDRIKDVILCSGYNVYPRQVEEAIYQHPSVAECLVVGMPDAYRGQTVKAYIVRRAGMALDQQELIAFLKDKLSAIEMPKIVEFRETLPKTAIGKLSRKALLDEAAAAMEPQQQTQA
ncbi:MAG TPA: long-chain fatty acid--CoA ligase [Stellaceae bacterium]|jgi:long-chain acyl-CoA synthetase